jgi:hypothetical protein
MDSSEKEHMPDSASVTGTALRASLLESISMATVLWLGWGSMTAAAGVPKHDGHRQVTLRLLPRR